MSTHEHACGCAHSHCAVSSASEGWNTCIRLSFSMVLLLGGLVFQWSKVPFFQREWVALCWFLVGWVPVAMPVMRDAWHTIREHDFFNEFTLMLVASLGAFYIGEYPEALAVMLFYSIGEWFQDKAVEKARRHIKSLLDVRPRKATVWRSGHWVSVAPGEVEIGEEIEVKTGERVPLDGVVADGAVLFNTAALTGESVPRRIATGEEVLAGMIPADQLVRIRVVRKFTDSALSRILDMVQNATSRKAPAEQFIRKFARVYTPVVTGLALLLVVVPWVWSMVQPAFVFDFHAWFYRALVFLVISCPCALVISIPLGYFGGIGAASRKGILFKGSNYLDAVAHVDTIMFDKTGTLTRGVFRVQSVSPAEGVAPESLVAYAAAAETGSTHPIAHAVCGYAAECGLSVPVPAGTHEMAGMGVRTMVEGRAILAGNPRLLRREGVACPDSLSQIPDTIVAVAVGGRYAGFLLLADEPKEDAWMAVSLLKDLGIRRLCILSGDKSPLVGKLAGQLGVSSYFGDLMPEDKVRHIEEAKSAGDKVAFVGDGLNDAPVLAASHVGIAMGGLGSDVAIEAADVVLQTDQPSKIAAAIKIARRTRHIVWENIVGAIGLKVVILVLGAMGVASLWAAVFADVGVALLAILNAMRLLCDKKY